MTLTPVLAAAQSLVQAHLLIVQPPVDDPLIPLRFNLTEYKISKGNNFAQIDIPGLSSPPLQFVRGAAATLTVDFLVDTSDTLEDVRDHIAAITDITSDDGDRRRRHAAHGGSTRPGRARRWPRARARRPQPRCTRTTGAGAASVGSRSDRMPPCEVGSSRQRAAPRDPAWDPCTRSATHPSSPPSGILALVFGAILPDWVDPIMGRVVGATLLFLGVWVFVSLYQYARHGTEFRLRSRWMLVFDSVRYAWRRLPGAAPRPRPRRPDGDELVRRADRVRRRDDPRRRGRDGHPGADHRRRRRRRRRRASASR